MTIGSRHLQTRSRVGLKVLERLLGLAEHVDEQEFSEPPKQMSQTDCWSSERNSVKEQIEMTLPGERGLQTIGM